MSERNGERSRLHRDRNRTLHRRQRIQQLIAVLRKEADRKHMPAASAQMQDEGGPMRTGD